MHPLIWLVIGLVVASAVIFAVAIAIPPEGEVHASVLKGLAIMTVNIALTIFAYAVVMGKTATFTHGNTSATVGGDKPANSEPRPSAEDEPETET